jgi:uncharacterized protein involved in copper resistance
MGLRQRVYANLEQESIRRTVELARSEGEAFDTPAFVAGIRFWF